MKGQQEGMTLGEKLRTLRKQAPMTQRELADRADLALATVKAIENGRNEPRPSTIRVLARALGVDPKVLTTPD